MKIRQYVLMQFRPEGEDNWYIKSVEYNTKGAISLVLGTDNPSEALAMSFEMASILIKWCIREYGEIYLPVTWGYSK